MADKPEIKNGKSAGSYVLEGFERFDQKNNMIFAGGWNETYEPLGFPHQVEGRDRLMSRPAPGYGPLDWALYRGASANMAAAGYGVNETDVGAMAWGGIPRKPGGLDWRDDALFPKYEADPETDTRVVKKVSRLFGAADVGVCELDRRFVYSHYYDPPTKQSYPIRFSDEAGYEQYTVPTTLPDKTQVLPAAMKYAVMMIFPMEPDGVMTSPVLTASATTFLAYSQMGFTLMSVAEFIRGLGFSAVTGLSDITLNVPLAIDAGLGEPTRNAKLAHPVYGSCCRIGKVLTDLPLIPDKPISFGVYERCKTCKICAQKCPSKAISMEDDMVDEPYGPYSHKHVRQWPMHHDRCKAQWVKMGTNCGVCIANCPLNHPYRMTTKEYWEKEGLGFR